MKYKSRRIEMKTELENGFLYSLWNGRFMVYEGCVTPSVFDDNLGNFKTRTKTINCNIKPKVVYNAVVWLSTRNDELAKQILIEYEEVQIIKLQFKIDNHLTKIKVLKEES